jgi:hypothetical protein
MDCKDTVKNAVSFLCRKLRKNWRLIMKKMLVAASVLAVITGVVAAVCKNRKKYTKVRTNY